MNSGESVSLELKDLEDNKEVFESILSELIGNVKNFHIIPPVPSQKLLVKLGLNKSILPVLNEALLRREPILDSQGKRLFIPFWYRDRVIGVGVTHDIEDSAWAGKNPGSAIMLAAGLFVENVLLEKKLTTDPETGLLTVSAFYTRLKALVDTHISGKRVAGTDKISVSPKVPPAFSIGLIRIFSRECYPVDLWSNRWFEIAEFARSLSEKMPPGSMGTLLPGGEISIVLPHESNARFYSSVEMLLEKRAESLHCALVDFPTNFAGNNFNGLPEDRDRAEVVVSEIFEKLWTIFNTTVSMSYKRIWHWNDLVCLGQTAETRLVFCDDFLANVQKLGNFSCFAMKFKEEQLEVSLYFACEKLGNMVEETLPKRGFSTWLNDATLVAVLPDTDEKEATELLGELLLNVGDSIGEALNVGVSYYPGGDFSKDQAIENSLKALVHASLVSHHGFVVVDSVTFNVSGDNFFNQGKLELAKNEYEKGIRLDPRNLNLLNSLGVCYGELGMLDRAEEVFEQVLELQPDNFMANFNLGCIQIRQKRLDEAEDMLLKAVQANPASAEAHFSLGKIKFEKKDYVNAAFHLEKAVNGRKSWKAASRLLAESYSMLGNRKKAMEHYKQVLRLDPEDPLSLHALGCLYGEKERNLEVAISLCEKAVGFDEKNKKYRLDLARLLFQAGDLRGALAQLDIILADDGANREAVELKRQIEDRVGRGGVISRDTNGLVQLRNPDLEK